MKTRRVSFDLEEADFEEWQAKIPHGLRAFLLHKLMINLLAELSEGREEFLARLYQKKLTTKDLLTRDESDG